MKKQFIVIALLALTSACKKETANIGDPFIKAVVLRDLSAANLSPENPANPYDSIGYLHNLLLSEIQPCVNSFSPIMEQDITGCVIPVANKGGLGGINVPFPLAPTIAKDSENDFRNIIGNSVCSEQVKTLLSQFVQTIKNVAINSNGDYPCIKSAVVAFEAKVISDRTLSNDDREVILSIASVTRYSMYYWHFLLPQPQELSLKRIITYVGTAMTDAVSLVVYKSVGFAVDSSEHAWWQMVYSIPGKF